MGIKDIDLKRYIKENLSVRLTDDRLGILGGLPFPCEKLDITEALPFAITCQKGHKMKVILVRGPCQFEQHLAVCEVCGPQYMFSGTDG